jgi:hypothetical protein
VFSEKVKRRIMVERRMVVVLSKYGINMFFFESIID